MTNFDILMTEPIIEENEEITKPALPNAKIITLAAILGLLLSGVEMIWGYVTLFPGLLLIIIAWWLIIKAKKVYYGFPDVYSDESNLHIDQARLVLFVASILSVLLILRALVVTIGGMVYS